MEEAVEEVQRLTLVVEEGVREPLQPSPRTRTSFSLHKLLVAILVVLELLLPSL